MRILSFPKESMQVPCCAVLGNFDGVHIGHQALMQKATAVKGDLQTVVYTFDVHPAVFLGKPVPYITQNALKEQYIASLDMDYLVYQKVSDAFLALSPQQFVEEILQKKLQAKKVVVGKHYTFGAGASGNSMLLKALCEARGIEVCIEDLVTVDGEVVSSTRIRQLLLDGETKRAKDLMGRWFQLSGKVVHGNHIGSKIGFPTMNFYVDEQQLLPAFGVYAVQIALQGKTLRGIANVGVKPTVQSDRPLVEVHVFDLDADCYGNWITVDFCRFLRKETKFETLDALKAQIAKDKMEAQQFFS